MRLIILGALLIVLCGQGCETLRGAAQGFDTDVKNTYDNIAGGADQTDQGLAKSIKAWMRENLW